jgi:4-amino-4-deoxy-L-arabinose transferase-like glycosyltransferase
VTPVAARRALVVVLLVYVALGTLYAVETPAWQAPDEPAHYNYIRHIAEEGALPVLRPGDFPAEYLEEIKARRFPPEMSVEPLRYESHQPPLYYLLSAGVYRLAQGLGAPTLLALRLWTLAIGTAALAAGFGALRRAVPGEPAVALGAVALAAALPMHVATSAAVNNDALVELLLAVVFWRLLAMARDGWTMGRALGLGALLGLAALTKMQAYVALALAAVALLHEATGGTWDARRITRRHLAMGGAMLGVAALVALPWLARNASVYGPGDPLALARHDLVVEGQPTTAAYLAEHGGGALAEAFVRTTFRSFWGQFGWMGVLLDERIYLALALLSALAGAGLVLYGVRRNAADPARAQTPLAGVLLVAWVAITVLGYLWWNVRYLQHQGRYLFPALVPIGVGFVLGIREWWRRPLRLTAPLLAVPGVGLLAWGAVEGDLPLYALGLVAAAGLGVAFGRWLERHAPGAAPLAVCAGLAALSVLALYRYILPALAL